ncbi:hypothetical protein CMI37_36100 [Candidatus Pacearchaeota archaeon]|nr:hypothetical protein [Candidatus Pacearchaeota archaeon]
MAEDDHEEPTWDTTEAVAVIEDAARRARRQDRISEAVSQAVGQGDITEAKLPIKVVIGLVLWVVSQALAGATLYYQLSGDIRSLQEGQPHIEDLVSMAEIQAIRVELLALKDSLHRVESSVQAPPTNLDHLRAIGDLRSDIRLLDQRVEFLERRR